LGAYLVVSTAISQRELYFQLIDLSAPFHPALRARAEKRLQECEAKGDDGLTRMRRGIVEDIVTAEARHG